MAAPKSPSHRRYAWRIFAAMVGYLATLFLAEWMIEDRGVTGPLAALLALLPGLAIAAVFWALGRLLIEEEDEYLRMLLVRQMLIATGLTMTVVTIWGTLAEFGIVEHGHAFYPVWLFFIGLGVGAVVNKLTLGHAGCP
jgi:hypothetical protein